MPVQRNRSITAAGALIVVDLQNDFLPGGALAVPGGGKVIWAANRYIELFAAAHQPVIFTRDWHPAGHCSFIAQGGSWPPHCVAGTSGANFAPGLKLPADARILSKAQETDQEAYSGFQGTDLAQYLKQLQVERLFVCGLATDYCVKATVLDGIEAGFDVFVLIDAVSAVDRSAGDGEKAIMAMLQAGARTLAWEALAA